MSKFKNLRYNLNQIIALTEKNIKLRWRFKYSLIISFITPLIAILMPLIVMGKFFTLKQSFGPWTAQNFVIFQFIAYDIMLLKNIISEFPSQLHMEKYWQTLPGLIIAPFNRFNLLFGIFISRLILISIPFTIFFILSFIFFPISIPTILVILLIYFIIAILFSGLGLILGIFAVSNENIWKLLVFAITIFFWFSCVSYPYEIFPEVLQVVININPLYYLFDFLRLLWIQDNVLLTISSYPYHFIILLISGIVFPILGVYTFEMIYKKYGIVGY